MDYYRAKAEKDEHSGIHIITRQVWAEGLRSVLKINIPFLDFQDYLGLPKRGVHGHRKGPIDYMNFLLRFKPVNPFIKGDGGAEANGAEQTSKSEFVERINLMLFKNRYELESLFRHLDEDGDGMISAQEFRDGVASLHGLLGHQFSPQDIDAVVKMVDTDGDGCVSYQEFFDSFKMVSVHISLCALWCG